MYGIIGYPLQQSFSPAYFNEKFRQLGIPEIYCAFPLETIAAFPALLQQHPYLHGLNVTMPHKQVIIPYLDELDETAKAIGAVNTVRIRNGRLKGYNTDITGFTDSLKPLLRPHHQKALVLGAGGAARAVTYYLQQLGIPFYIVSRTKSEDTLTYADLDATLMAACTLVINTSPLGMVPDTDLFPDIPYEYLTGQHLAYDLIYKPAETVFLQKARAQHAQVQNSYDMLIGQAEAAWAIWQENK